MTTKKLQTITNSIEQNLVDLKSQLSEKDFINTLQELVYMSKTLIGTKMPITSKDFYNIYNVNTYFAANAIKESLKLKEENLKYLSNTTENIKSLALLGLHKQYLNKLNSLKLAMKLNSGIKKEGNYKFFTAKDGKDVETTKEILQDIVSNFHSDYYCYAKKIK